MQKKRKDSQSDWGCSGQLDFVLETSFQKYRLPPGAIRVSSAADLEETTTLEKGTDAARMPVYPVPRSALSPGPQAPGEEAPRQ